MQTGYVMFFFIFPVVLEGCCEGSHQRKQKAAAAAGLTGLQQNSTHLHYRAVEGEIFMMPGTKCMWCRTGDGTRGNEGPCLKSGKDFQAKAKLSGKYSCLTGELFLHLQVVDRINLGCFRTEENKAELVLGPNESFPCPGSTCSNNTDVIWYKGNKAVSEQDRESCEKGGQLHLCEVKEFDPGVYFCDAHIIEQGVTWTLRTAVNVTVIPHRKPTKHPRIVYPPVNTTEEVELGQPCSLICEVFFDFEKNISAKVEWYKNYDGNKEIMTLLNMELPQRESEILREYKITRRAVIEEVTPQDLNHTYTCIASYVVGKTSVTLNLKMKITEKWPSLVGYPVVFLLLIAGLGIVLHVKWLEVQLIYKSHFQHGKHGADEKEFDVLVSYVWSPPSAEVQGGWSLSSRSGPDTDEEECPLNMHLLNTEEGKATKRPLEVLLPQMLEKRWGYRLCLLERDMLPGGAYTNDVVLAIQKSQMLICLLSADYLSNSNAVFVLESGVQALLQNSKLKLLLIWTNRDTAFLIQQDPPLPTLVQRALKVLPSLNWTSGRPAKATCNFWRSLRKAMPRHRVKVVSLMQEQ